MQKPTIFTGVATLTEHEGNSIIISAGSLEALKAYLGESRSEGDPEVCQVSITVGPRAEIVLPSMAGLLAAKEFAALLGERVIGKEIDRDEEKLAKDRGLVVVYGGSDDLTEFRGAIRDELGLGKLQFTAKGKFFDPDRLEELEGLVHDGLLKSLPELNCINANYCITGHHYTTDIPHAQFSVLEDGEVFCVGIVFHISDLK